MTAPRQYNEASDPNLAYPSTAPDERTRYPAGEFSDADPAAAPAGSPFDPPSARHTDVQHAEVQHGDTRHGDIQPGDIQPGNIQPTPDRAATAGPTGDALFAEGDLSELRARWNDVQAAFVDDPRACVQQADGLVSSAVEQLTASFSNTRSKLEDQWSRGEEASTEDLRIALKRYRDFFDRLLAV